MQLTRIRSGAAAGAPASAAPGTPGSTPTTAASTPAGAAGTTTGRAAGAAGTTTGRAAGRPARAGGSGTQRRWALALTSVAFFMTALDALVVVTALPAIHDGLGGSLSTLEWTVNAYTLTFAAGIITAAALGDRLGRRRMYVTGLVAFVVASAGCALAPSANALIAARAVQGLGAALIAPLSLTILASAFPAERRGTIVGIWGAIGGLAVAGGPLVGGAVVQGLSWHWIFWINVPVGLAAAALSLVRLPESHGPAGKLDIPGAMLAAGGALAIAWGLVKTSSAGWGSTSVIAALAAGVLLLAAFVRRERRVRNPMLPLRLLRVRAFTATNATGFAMMGAITSAAFLMSQYFQFGLGYGPLATGLRFLPWTATPLLIAPIAGRFTDRIGPRPLMAGGLLLQALGLGWVALDASNGAGYGRLVVPLVIAGIGASMAIPSTPAAALNSVPRADMGTASGVQNTLQRFGAVFGVAVAGAVFGAAGHLGAATAVISGVRPALAVSAGLSLVGSVTALAAGRRSAQRTPEANGAPRASSAPTANHAPMMDRAPVPAVAGQPGDEASLTLAGR